MFIIKIVKGMMWLGAGVAGTLLYQKYNKDIIKQFKKVNKKVKEVK